MRKKHNLTQEIHSRHMSQKLQKKAAGSQIKFPRAFPLMRLVRSSGVTDCTKTTTEFRPLSLFSSRDR